MMIASTANLLPRSPLDASRPGNGLPLAAVVLDHPAGVSLEPHSHQGGQLSIVTRGTMIVTSDEGWWLVPPGLAIWVPSGTRHGVRYSESSSLINVMFSPDSGPTMPEQCGPVVVSDLMRELAREATRVCAELNVANPPDRRVPSLGLMAALLALQVQRPAKAPGLFVPHGRDRRLRVVIDLLRQAPASPHTLDDLAVVANTSPRTLARLFVTETGMTFGRWRDHLRVVTAVDLLARGVSITRVALELGYASATSFTTLFTRRLGVPPRRYMLLWRETAPLPGVDSPAA